MADRYFDRNGTTAGFGTLTGAWDTTTASWSTSNAGTATPTAFTFTNADVANFGSSAVASTTGGTATIATGVTVTANGIRLRNIAGNQTIARAGTGNLVLSGTSPFIDHCPNSTLSFTTPVTANNLSVFVTGVSIVVINSATSGLITGTLAISGNALGHGLVLGTAASGTPNQISSVTNINLAGAGVYWLGNTAYTEDAVIAVASDASNCMLVSAAPLTISDASIATYTGELWVQTNGGQFTQCSMTLNSAPLAASNLRMQLQGITNQAGHFARYVFANASGATIPANMLISLTAASLTSANVRAILEDNSSGNIFSGTVSGHDNATGFAWLLLQGTASNSRLTGNFTTGAGTTGLQKDQSGTWTISGNNTYTGSNVFVAGKVSAQSNTALGAATSAGGVTISGTGALELSGGITLDKSSTPFTIHQTSPIVSVGDNTVRTAGVTLGGTTTFEVTTGNRLAISNTGAITDGASTFGITKTGDGELALAAFTNTYDGAVAVSAGTLAIGSQGALGNGNVTLTGTLKYTGTGETYSRSTFLSGAAPSLEAAGSGAITVTNLSQDSTTKTLTLKGANTGANTVTVALSDSSNPLSLAKSGAGKWVTTGALSYSGSTTVSDGTLRVQTANSNTTSGAVTIGANGAVELVTDTLASTGGGAVLGSSHVAVNGGIIKTRGGTTQKGQVRYGGNLTFGAGSTLYIGAAA